MSFLDIYPAPVLPSPPVRPLNGPLASLQAWLDQPLVQAQPDDVLTLKAHLAVLNQSLLPATEFLRLLDALLARATALGAVLEPALAAASLPLPQSMRTVADGLVRVHGIFALSYERVLTLLSQGREEPAAQRAAVLARAMTCAARQLNVADLVCMAPPVGAWQMAHRVYQQVEQCVANAPDKRLIAATDTYKSLLALSSLAPAGFTPQEISWTQAFLVVRARDIEISRSLSVAWRIGAYWVDLDRDLAPQAVIRKPGDAQGKLLYFSCSKLVSALRQIGTDLDLGAAPDSLDIPPFGTPSDVAALLVRLRRRWATPAKRNHNRRVRSYPVELQIGLDAIWRSLEPAANNTGQAATIWHVTNESPAGFCVEHGGSASGALRSGEVVSLRRPGTADTCVCVVRWIRTRHAGGLELGLELLALSAHPVQIVAPDRDTFAKAVPALILPPLPALRQNEALLTPKGCYNPRGKFVVARANPRVSVVEVRSVHLDEQTSRIDVFQFERDACPDLVRP